MYVIAPNYDRTEHMIHVQLISLGANVNFLDDSYNTALHYAALTVCCSLLVMRLEVLPHYSSRRGPVYSLIHACLMCLMIESSLCIVG